MKLVFTDKFSLEIPLENGQEEVIKGTVRELKKSEQKEIKAIYKEDKLKEKTLNKLIKEASRFEEKFERDKPNLTEDQIKSGFERLDKYEQDIEEQTENLNSDEMIFKGLRIRFDKTIVSDKKDRLREICEEFGYPKVYEAINRDIEEKKAKK